MLKNKKQEGENLRLTVMFKINPTKEQKSLIDKTMLEYIKAVNSTVNSTVDLILEIETNKLSSKDIIANLPSAVKNQASRDSKTITTKYKKSLKKENATKKPILRKRVCIWNNQNYKISDSKLSFPLIFDNKSKRIDTSTLESAYMVIL